MHECYAMKILEKEQKTKNNGHEGKSNEAQVPRKPRQIKDKESHQLLNKDFKLTSIKRFGEDIDILSFSRDILKTHNLSFNKISK